MPDESQKRSSGRAAKGGLGSGPGSASAPPGRPARARGIGRGLEAILAASPAPGGGAARADAELRELPVHLVVANPDQPRRRFDPDELEALAASVEAQGVLQPVLVRPRPGGRYEVVAGERRWRAAQLAGLETIPAVIRERSDAETLEAALIENMARQDLTPIEEARACAGLVEELGISREDVARRVGRSRSAVSNLIRLLDLPDEIVELIEDRRLSEGHGRALLLSSDQAERRRLGLQAVDEGWSVREVERRARPPRPDAGSDERPGRSPDAPDGPSADHKAAAIALSDELSAALGLDVTVRPRGSGYRVELSLDDHAQAEALVDRLR